MKIIVSVGGLYFQMEQMWKSRKKVRDAWVAANINWNGSTGWGDWLFHICVNKLINPRWKKNKMKKFCKIHWLNSCEICSTLNQCVTLRIYWFENICVYIWTLFHTEENTFVYLYFMCRKLLNEWLKGNEKYMGRSKIIILFRLYVIFACVERPDSYQGINLPVSLVLCKMSWPFLRVRKNKCK